MSEIRVGPDALHTAGNAVGTHASSLRDGTGGVRLALSNATGAAAHPDAQAAIDSFRQHAEAQLAYWADAVTALSQGLHNAAGEYVTTDSASAQALGAGQ
jgi:Excreted virulence factor EspC, type VII ESX diderm